MLHSRAFRIAVRAGFVLAMVLLSGVTGAVTALAQTTYPPPVEVAPEVIEKAKPAPAAAQEEGALAFTGAELTLLLVTFALLLAAGALVLIAARRRAARSG
jgi:hypothetical protein